MNLRMLTTTALKRVYFLVERIPLLGAAFRAVRVPVSRLVYDLVFPDRRRYWEDRIRDVMASEDNARIPRVPEAGKLEGTAIIMHNGIKVDASSYYGEGNRELLMRNRGVHEPQEEIAFQEVLKYLPEKGAMIELGAYWGFYSMWFHRAVAQPSCYLVEPGLDRLECGRTNFRLNNMQGTFIHGLVGKESGAAGNGTPTVSVDNLVSEYDINSVTILHSDIQGAELDMLHGCRQTLDRNGIDYIFISTHSNELHTECTHFLEQEGYDILASADLNETYSVDGILVAKRKGVSGPEHIDISHKT